MAEIPVVQILEKDNYANQHIVPLPDEVPYPALTTPTSLRLRTKVLSLTVNNLTYARIGFLFKWWDFHPLPPSTPAEYKDPAKYGRINCWGFAEVLESTASSVPKGSYVYGYLPLDTLAQDLTVREGDVPGQMWVTNDHRKDVMPFYNRYLVFPASLKEKIEAKADSVAMDAAVRVVYETSYLLNRFAFAESPEDVLHPSQDTSRPWTAAEANLSGATVIVFAPGSKTAAAFAFEVRHARKQAKAKRVVGAASDYSKSFVEGTGLYDEVVSTNSSPSKLLSRLQVGEDERVVIIDFGGRAGAAPRWAEEIQGSYNSQNFTMLSVGPSIDATAPQEVLQSLGAATGGAIVSMANDMRLRAMEKLGEREYWEGLNSAWEEFRDRGVIKGLKFRWGEGMDDVKKGWDALCTGNVGSDEGLLLVVAAWYLANDIYLPTYLFLEPQEINNSSNRKLATSLHTDSDIQQPNYIDSAAELTAFTMNQPDTTASSLRPSRRTPKMAMRHHPVLGRGASQEKKTNPHHHRTTNQEACLACLAAMDNTIAGIKGALRQVLHHINNANSLLDLAEQYRLAAEAAEGTVEDDSVPLPNGSSSVHAADDVMTAVLLNQDASAEADWEQSPPPTPKSSVTFEHEDHSPHVASGAQEESVHQSSVPLETTEAVEAVEELPRNNGSQDTARDSSFLASGTFEEQGEEMPQLPVPLAEQEENEVQSASTVSDTEEPLTEAQDGAARESDVVDEKGDIAGRSRQAKKKLRQAEKKIHQEEEKARQTERKIHQSEKNRKKKERRKERKAKDQEEERNAKREEEELEPTSTADVRSGPAEQVVDLPRLAELGLDQLLHNDNFQKHQTEIKREIFNFWMVAKICMPDLQDLIRTSPNDTDSAFFRGCLEELNSHTKTVDAEVEAIQAAGGDISEVRTLLRDRSKSMRITADKVNTYKHDQFQIEIDRFKQFANSSISSIEALVKICNDTHSRFYRGCIEEIKEITKSVDSEVEAIHAAGGNINEVHTVLLEKGESMTVATNKVYAYEEEQIKEVVYLFKEVANDFASETESFIGPSTNDIDSGFYRGCIEEMLELARILDLEIETIRKSSRDPHAVRKLIGCKWASMKAIMEKLRSYEPISDDDSDTPSSTHSACQCGGDWDRSEDQDQPDDESEGRTMNELERYLLKEASQEENGLRTEDQQNQLGTEGQEVSPILAYLARLTAWEENIIVPMQNHVHNSENFVDEQLTPRQIKVRLHLRCFEKMRTAPLTPLLPMPAQALDLVQKYINPLWFLAVPLEMRHHDVLGEAGAWYQIGLANDLYWLKVLEGRVTVDWIYADDDSQRPELPNCEKGFFKSFMPREVSTLRVIFQEDSIIQAGHVPANQEALDRFYTPK